MSAMLRLRRGERLNPAEFSDEFLAPMHARLDAIAVEQRRDARREMLLRFLSWLMNILAIAAVVVLLWLWFVAGMGWL